MGLCKCRNVTNLYCFVHRQHVCENCCEETHNECVIGTYLDWLRDSDYDWPAPCPCCHEPMGEGADVMRLMCMHLVHVACLDEYGQRLPANTALAGFGCPTCARPIMPESTSMTKLAISVRERLELSPWAQKLKSFNASSTSKPTLTLGDQVVVNVPHGGSAAVGGGARTAPGAGVAAVGGGTATSGSVVLDMPTTPARGSSAVQRGGQASTVLPYDAEDDKYTKTSTARVDMQRIVVIVIVLSLLIGALLVVLLSGGSSAHAMPR